MKRKYFQGIAHDGFYLTTLYQAALTLLKVTLILTKFDTKKVLHVQKLEQWKNITSLRIVFDTSKNFNCISVVPTHAKVCKFHHTVWFIYYEWRTWHIHIHQFKTLNYSICLVHMQEKWNFHIHISRFLLH